MNIVNAQVREKDVFIVIARIVDEIGIKKLISNLFLNSIQFKTSKNKIIEPSDH